MKKIFLSILAVAALSASCTKFAEDGPIDFKETEAPEVTAKTLADDRIEVSVTAKEGTSFFSYIVAEGDAVQTDAETLLEGKSSLVALKYEIADEEGNPVEKTAAAVLDYTKSQSVTLTIGGLSSNTAYTVYAVASNNQGVVSEVAVATATTTDETAPQILPDYVDFMEQDGLLIVAIPFDDPVALSGKGGVTAHFYAAYTTPDADGNLVAQKTVELTQKNECLEADGDVLYVVIPKEEYTPGAIVTFTYPAGIVTNALGAECAAFEDASISAKGETDGIAAEYKTATFKLSVNEDGDTEGNGMGETGDEEEAEPTIFTDWEKLVMTSYSQSAYPLAGKSENAEVTISVVDANDRTVTYKAQTFKAIDTKKIGIALNEAPGYGVYVSYKIAAGSFLDIYGNESEEFAVENGYYSSYGYTVDDIIGTYSVVSKNAFTGEDSPEYKLVVEKSDDEEKGNIVITNYLGIEGKIYTKFNFDNGQFSIEAEDTFSGTEEQGYATYFHRDGKAVFNVPAAGKIVCFDYYVGAAIIAGGEMTGYAKDGAGNNLLLYDFEATRN